MLIGKAPKRLTGTKFPLISAVISSYFFQLPWFTHDSTFCDRYQAYAGKGGVVANHGDGGFVKSF